MQWHWGNIGSAAAGLSTLLVAARLLWSAPDWYRTWKERQQAERDLAREQAEQIQLDRHRHVHGWSGHGIDTFGVELVTSAEELAQAAEELAVGLPSDYVVFRVAETEHGNANRAASLRHIVDSEGYISRPPTAAEREAVEIGLGAMGIPQAAYGRST